MRQKDGLDYCIAFDTKDVPGKIRCVRVQLDTVIIGPDDAVRVDLTDHPLYPRLVDYVMNNPPRGRKAAVRH
jgi:hypothetical protein